jgi:hypothetical protein
MFTRRRAERGQGSLESVGIILLAAILVGSVVGLVVQTSPSLRDEVSYRICQIIHVFDGGGCEAPSEPRTADDRVPEEPCMANSESISAEATASVVVTVRRGYSFLIEEMSDGTYKVTRVDDFGVGTGVGPGIDVSLTIDGKKYGVTAIASADAMLAGKMGETWYADDEDGANDIIKDIIANDVVDEVAPEVTVGGVLGTPEVTIPNPVNRAIKAFIGDPGDSDESFVEGGLEGSAGATLSGITASAGATVDAEQYLGAKETPDGYTAYFRTELNGEAYGAVIGEDATATAGGEVLTELVFDDDGTPKSIKMTTGVTLDAETDAGLEDDQSYTETSVEVPLSGDPRQDAPLYAALTGNPVAVANLVDEAKEDGYMTQNVYSQDPNSYGINLGGSLLGEYGGSVSGDVTTRELQDALYWDGNGLAPRPDC